MASEAAVAQAKAGRAAAEAALAQAESQVGQAQAKLAEATAHVEEASALIGLVVRELRAQEPIVDLRVLGNRNSALGTALIFLVGVVLYGTIALLPLFLQTLMGYPALQAGLATSPRGLGSFVAMFIVGRLVGKLDNRWLLLFGFAVLGFSAYQFSSITLDIAMSSVVWPGIINGFALGFVFAPLTDLAMGNLANEQMGNATGIYNLMRNLGGGVGIAWVTTLLSRGSQAAQANLAANTSAYNPAFQERIAAIANGLTPPGNHPNYRDQSPAITG